MTTQALPSTPRSATTPIAMHRLVEVELRKTVDTRAGRWMLIGIGALVAVVLAIVIATSNAPGTTDFANLVRIGQFPVSILLPVLGVLAATSEWSQRTILGTFSLVPSRGRSLTSKIAASVVLAGAAFLVALLFSAIATVLAPVVSDAPSPNWTIGLSDLGEILAYQWLCMLLGVALGTAFLNSALGIVLYFALPTIWGGITGAFDSLSSAQLWLDTGTSWIRLLGEAPVTTQWWERIATTSLLWIALPLAIGTVRVLRREVD